MYACLSLLSFLLLRVTISNPPSLQAAPMEQRITAKRGLHPSTHPLSQPPGKPIPPPTPPTHTHSLTHTHTPPTETQKSLCHAPSTRGSNMFWRLLLLCSDPPSVHIHRGKARGRKVKSRRRQKAGSVEEQRRRKGPNLRHCHTGEERLRCPSWSLGSAWEGSSALGSPSCPHLCRCSRGAVGSRGEGAHILPAPLSSSD